ncbi:phosphodiesterase [Flavobacterium faecale]|uniref:Phosphodiesterase n=1 Tax=Flavobacterium faecale TaxID=1355330 RepID=A0A2S1LDB9_9FLAO|nr:alkaline phosphatase D family protein [Flavobacterium faecale]AWG21708.1 phosphodiesterase [Flavobacterium faecale]
MRSKLSVLAFFISIVLFAQNGILKSGPMVGYCEMKEAMIWLQTTETAKVKIEYFDIENPTVHYFSDEFQSSKEVAYTYHILLDQLQEGKKYQYQLIINDKKVTVPYETTFRSKKFWQWRENAPEFKIAFGSCSYINENPLDRPGKGYGSEYEIFETIAKQNPDIMLWGGDNTYLREADYDSKTGIYHRNTHTRAIKEIQPLLAKAQNIAIWDDHDFGPDDSNRSFYNKYLTQKAFKDFWANKSYGMDPSQQEGVYTTFNWGDAEFFLLDNRFFRSPDERKTGKLTMLGDKQLEWLIDALATSRANFKIVVIGGQVLNSDPKTENYGHYPEEKEKLLSEIAANDIKGVLFLSGDRHFSELSRLERPNTYPLYDWTVSPLTAGVASGKYVAYDNKLRVKDSAFFTHNFGTITFSRDNDNRKMELLLLDKDGNTLWTRTITKNELQ